MTAAFSLPGRHGFGVIDWAILAAYAGTVLGVGFHYARRQCTTEEYFLGGRNTRPFLAGISLFAATTSIITCIGTPGEYVQYGPGLILIAFLPALPVLQYLIGHFYIPVVMRLPITSAYELLETRLGMSVRKTGSICYIISRFIWMSVILYVCSTMMMQVLGCDPRWRYFVAILIGAVTTTYTLFGGIRAVMITGVIQFFILLSGSILTLVLITLRLGGIAAWWPTHGESYWPSLPIFSFDPRIRGTLVGGVIFTVVANFTLTGSDQASIQRFLTTPDVKAARRAFLLSNIASAGITILLVLVGAALVGFYRSYPLAAPGLNRAEKGDAFFPLFISHELPTGIAGLMVASLLAMSMSCLSAGINASIAVITKDLMGTSVSRPKPGDAAELHASRWIAMAIGLCVILGSLLVGAVSGDIFEISNKTESLLGSAIFGLFFMAIFVKFSTPFGAIMGAIYSAAAASLLACWNSLSGQPALSFTWIAPVSFGVSMAASCLFSLLPTRGRRRGVIAGYTVASLAAMAAAIAAIIHHFR